MIPRTEHASLPKKVLWVILIPVTKINWAVGPEILVKSPDQAVSVALDGGRTKLPSGPEEDFAVSPALAEAGGTSRGKHRLKCTL